jgi:peptidyl-prolyl cis-trans isomerase D
VLESIRKSAGESLVLKILFGIIALVFVFFYVGTGGFSQLEVAARVNEQLITKRDFDRAYGNLDRFYRNAAPNNLPSATQLSEQAMAQLINTEILVQEAANLGLEVGEDELRDTIASLNDFQIDGRFNKTRYLETLQMIGMKPSDFENEQRRQMLATKVLEIVRAGVHVTDTEIEQYYHFENDRVTLRFIRVPRASFMSEVSFTDADLTKFYEEAGEQFREPDRTVVRYLAFRPEAFEDDVKPTDEDLRIYYDEQRSAYEVGEQVRARHILLKLAPDASDEEKKAVRQRAIEIRKRALEGEDFATLAQENSEDSTASAGGDLGAFGRGVMTGAFEEASFALEPGQISDLVETQFGVHVIKLEEKTAAHTRSLDEVREEVSGAVRKREARVVTLRKVEEAFDKLLDGASLADAGAEYSVEVTETTPFASNEVIPGLGFQPKVAEAALALGKGELSEIMNFDGGYVIFQVAEKVPSHIPPQADVRAEVEDALRETRAGEAAFTRAKALLTGLRADGDIDAVAESAGLEVQETGEIGRYGGFIPKLGSVPALAEQAFKLTAENRVAPEVYIAEGDAVLAVLGERSTAPADQLEAATIGLANQLRSQKEGATIQDFIGGLRERAKIELGDGYSISAES